MLFGLMFRGLRRGVARFACAVAGVAVAAGGLAFVSSLVATNDVQAPRRAERLLAELPLEDTSVAFMTLDYRPGGRVMQGPPMRAVCAVSSGLAGDEVLVTRALFAQRRLPVPSAGTSLKLVGRKGTHVVTISDVFDWEIPARGVPNVFVSAELAASIDEDWSEFVVPTVAELAPGLKGDEQRRMDYAKPLLLVAAFLTALSLLVNSLLLSVESNRGMLMTLRTVGLTRWGIVRFVTAESMLSGLVGWVVGVVGAAIALSAYVACDTAAFPAGVAFAYGRIGLTLALLPLIVFLSVVFALSPALGVRAANAAAVRPRSRRRGMAIAFACGFAAFVAVEVWGASLMRGFVPSPEWPDAIVSLLPGGASSWDVEKLRTVEGVRRISELVPRQLPTRDRPSENVLFLAAEFLPEFRFVEGEREAAERAMREGDGVVIALMVSNAFGLHVGDRLRVMQAGRRGSSPRELSFPVVGVVDVNWHMVTSRGLVRGLNGSPAMTDGPVFCSFDTMGEIDMRTYVTDPAMSAPMTHLWVEYDREFLARHGVFKAGRIIEEEIARRLGNLASVTVRLHARDEIADGTLAHGTDLIGQAARVPFAFLAILAIGFVAMLVAEADAKKNEFAILRAVGITRVQLAIRLTASAVKTALVGIAVSIPIGTAAGWYAAIGTAAHWPGMPNYLVIPWQIVAEGAFGAVVFALVFAVPTAVMLINRATKR